MGRGARGSRASSRSGSADDTASVQDLEQREAERTLAQAQARVVSAVIEYDGYLDEIKRITKSTIQAYRAARLHSQRQDSFDQLTAMLGPYLPARGGFTDWRGRDVKGMQKEILQNGPIEVAFFVYSDFQTYTSGVYHRTASSEGPMGGHAVRILGW